MPHLRQTKYQDFKHPRGPGLWGRGRVVSWAGTRSDPLFLCTFHLSFTIEFLGTGFVFFKCVSWWLSFWLPLEFCSWGKCLPHLTLDPALEAVPMCTKERWVHLLGVRPTVPPPWENTWVGDLPSKENGHIHAHLKNETLLKKNETLCLKNW